MNCGGGPAEGAYSSYIGGEYWRNPGAFANGFKGVCTVFVTAAFSFGEWPLEIGWRDTVADLDTDTMIT